jgi:hypothetical protein
MTGVSLALRCTRVTRTNACRHLGPAEIEIQLGPASGDLPRRVAYRGAVEAETDAFDELRHFRLAEAGVGASDTNLLTFDAGLDTLDECGIIDFERLSSRMNVQHLANQAVRTLHACHRRRS